MIAPEFSREFDIRSLPGGLVMLTANREERAALARRFGLVAIERLTTEVALAPAGALVEATGRLHAAIVQSCAVSGEDFPVTIDEPLALRFVPERRVEQEEVELEAEDLDEIGYTGTGFDLGEAVAQSLALAIDPYAAGPGAEAARREAGLSDEAASGPLAAALAALRKA